VFSVWCPRRDPNQPHERPAYRATRSFHCRSSGRLKERHAYLSKKAWPTVRKSRLDDAERIKLHARLIGIYAVRSHAMPPGNITEISGDDRRILEAWLAALASAD
jgi:uncharacterized membrane protein